MLIYLANEKIYFFISSECFSFLSLSVNSSSRKNVWRSHLTKKARTSMMKSLIDERMKLTLSKIAAEWIIITSEKVNNIFLFLLSRPCVSLSKFSYLCHCMQGEIVKFHCKCCLTASKSQITHPIDAGRFWRFYLLSVIFALTLKAQLLIPCVDQLQPPTKERERERERERDDKCHNTRKSVGLSVVNCKVWREYNALTCTSQTS